MLRWMTPFLVAIFAIGTAAAQSPGAGTSADGPAAEKPADPPAAAKPADNAPASKPNDSPSAKPADNPAGAKRAEKAAAAQARRGSRRQPIAARPTACPLQLPHHGYPAAAPLYVRRGRTWWSKKRSPCRLPSSGPMRRASSARRCCRAHRRCPAITGPSHSYSYDGPYYGGPLRPYWNRLPYACGVYGYC